MYVRQVDGARSEVDEGHGDTLPLQSGEIVEVHSAELEVVDEVVRVGAAQSEGEVFLVEGRDLLLQVGQAKRYQQAQSSSENGGRGEIYPEDGASNRLRNHNN